MKRFLTAFVLFVACSLMGQPQPILRNGMTTNIAGTPVLSRSDLSVTNVGSGTNWLFYGTAPNTVARLVDIALGAGTLWATLVSNADGSVTVYTNTANVGTNIYGLSSATFVNYASNALQTSMSNTVGYVSNILNTGIVTSSNKAHLDLTNLTVLVSNNMHLDLTNLNVVTSNSLQSSMSNTVSYVSNILTGADVSSSNKIHLDMTNYVVATSNSLQGSMSNTVSYVSNILTGADTTLSNNIHLDLTNLTVLVSNSTHLDMTNLVNNAASNRVVVIAGANVTVATNSPAANVMSYTVASTGGGSGAPFATVVTNANGTVTIYTNASVTGTNIYGLAVADPLSLTTLNIQDLYITNIFGVFTNANNFGTNKPGVAGNSLLSDGGYIYWGTPAGGGDVTTAQLNAASNSLHLDMTNLNVVTSNALQQSMSNTVDYASNILESTILYSSNQTHLDLTNLVNNAASNRIVITPGANITVVTSSPAANIMQYEISDNAIFGQAWFVWGSSNTLATNSGGVAYKAMQKSDVTLPATPNTNTYTTPTAGQYIGEVITAIPAGVTAILPGSIDTVSFIYLSENRTMVLQPEIYLRTNMIAPSWTVLGELEIGTGPQFTVNNVFNSYTISVAITTNVPMSVTNYLVRKYKVISVSGGTPNAILVSQGQYPSRVTFPIGSSAFVLKSGDTMSGNLVVNSSIGINTNTTASAFHVLANPSQTNLIVAGLTTGDYKFVVSTNGDIMVNFNSVPAELSLIGTAISARGADNAQVRLAYSSYGAAGLGAFAGRHARGTAGSKSAVQAGDVLISLEGWGYGATAYSASPRAFIRGYAGGTWTDSTQPAYIALWTCDAGGIVPVERIRINTNGTVGFATNSPQEVLHVNGSGRFQTNVVTMWDGAHYGSGLGLTNLVGISTVKAGTSVTIATNTVNGTNEYTINSTASGSGLTNIVDEYGYASIITNATIYGIQTNRAPLTGIQFVVSTNAADGVAVAPPLIVTNGAVGIGIANPTFGLHIAGTLKVVGETTSGTVNSGGYISANNYYIVTNALPLTHNGGATPNVQNTGSYVYVMTNNITFTNISGFRTTAENKLRVMFVNNSGGDLTVGVATSFMSSDGKRTWYVTNNCRAYIDIESWGTGVYTNATFRNFW